MISISNLGSLFFLLYKVIQASHITLNVEAAWFSKTVSYHIATWYHNPKDCGLNELVKISFHAKSDCNE
jgi:hypothetical protein